MSLYLKSKQTGNSGEALVESSLSHHAIIHRVDGSKDVGLDMICEWVNGEKPTQTMFGIQVKTTENIKLRPKNNKSRLNQLEEFWGCITIEQKTELINNLDNDIIYLSSNIILIRYQVYLPWLWVCRINPFENLKNLSNLDSNINTYYLKNKWNFMN